MKTKKPPKLTLKAAKALALRELGAAAGLAATESNNSNYQRYEVWLGNYLAVITNDCAYWGVACVYFCGTRTYFNIDTLEENVTITRQEQNKDRREDVRDFAASNSGYMFQALLEQYGLETCRRMLEKVAEALSK